MLNNDLLAIYVDAIKLLHAEDSVLVQDSEFKVVYMSSRRMSAIGLKNIDDVLGVRLQDLPQLVDKKNTLETINNIDAIMSQQESGEFIVSDPDLFVCTKIFSLTCRQLIDPTTKSVVGYANFVESVGLENRVKLLYEMLGINADTKEVFVDSQDLLDSSQINKLKFSIELTERECEILFLLCLRFSGREIAEIISKQMLISITPSTIGNIIRQQLFRKFEVYNIDELIRKAINLGYWNIPSSYCKHRLINLSN